MEGETFIYVIKCPLTNRVVYVGRSWKPYERFKQHQASAHKNISNVDLSNWIASLNMYGYKPVFKIIDNKDTEDYWIIHYSKKGCLFNRHRLTKYVDLDIKDIPILPKHYANLMREIRQNSIKNKSL